MTQNSPTIFLFERINANDECFNPFLNFNISQELFPDIDEDEDNDQKGVQEVSKKIQKPLSAKRKYINTSHELRLELIEAVSSRGEKIKSAAKRLGINYSTAKAICQVFKREGRNYRKIKSSKPRADLQINQKGSSKAISPVSDLSDFQEKKDITAFNEENYLKSSLEISKNQSLDSQIFLRQEGQVQKLQAQQCTSQAFPQDLSQNQATQANQQLINQGIQQTRNDHGFSHLNFPSNPLIPLHPYITPSGFIAPHNARAQQFLQVPSYSNYKGNEAPPLVQYLQTNYVPNNQNTKIQYINPAAYLVPQAYTLPPQVLGYQLFPYNPPQSINQSLNNYL